MFDGSLTPPLSDISDCDADAADNGDVRRENSPVLAAKRPKKSNKISKRKLSLDECTIISPRTNETECYCMISDLQFLTDIFYSASNFILYLEHKAIESNKIHPGFKCSDQDIKPVFRILDSFIKKFDGVNYKDQACHLIEKLDVLCGEVALVADIGPKHMHRLLSSKFRLSVEERNLHECGSHELVSWIHCFCDVNMYALKVTRVAKEKCAQLNIIEILHSSGMAVNDDHDLLIRTCSRILHQLFYMVSQAYTHLKHKCQNSVQKVLKYLPLACKCFNDIMELCFNSCQEHGFWGILTNIFVQTLQNGKAMKRGDSALTHIPHFADSTDAVSCFWWWLVNMPFSAESSSFHVLMTRLLRISCVSSDEEFTIHLLCYKEIIRKSKSLTWTSVETTPFLLLWQHFCKNLNNNFNKQTGIKQFTLKTVSSIELISSIRNLRKLHLTNPVLPNSSFHGFLALFDCGMQLNDGALWCAVKERFLACLESGGMDRLDSTGVTNFFSICIAIAARCPSPNIVEFISEFIKLFNQCSIARSDYAKQIAAVTGLFSLMHLLCEMKVSFNELSNKVCKLFTQVCRLLSEKSIKLEHRHSLLSVFNTYLQSAAQLFQASSELNLGQKLPEISEMMGLTNHNTLQWLHTRQQARDDLTTTCVISLYAFYIPKVAIFPAHSMDSVLERAKPSEISSILPHIADIFSCLRKMSTFTVECSKLCHHLTPDILSCLKKQIGSIDGPMDIYVDNLHVLMADIVMVTFMINNDSGVSPAMLNLWGYFASEGRVDVRIRCRFLISILGEPNIRSALHEEHTASHGNNGRSILNDTALQGWMKCNLMSCVIGSNMMETLHSCIAQLEPVRLVVGDITEKFTFHLFLEALADKHRKSQNFLERVQWSSMSTRWFSSVVDSAIHEMRSTEPNIVSSIYHTTGDIVLHCCHMLFTPGKPCPVSKLLDNIVAVQYLPESSCATSTHALRTSVHKFILGGLKVGLNVSYIKRTLKQILSYYINKWSISDEKNTNHPFLQVLHHPTSTTTMQDGMLGLLLESTDDNQIDKLAMVLQILHIWWNSEERKVAQYPVLKKYPPFLQQARVKLRFNQVLVGKATDLLQTFRQLTQ